jgi:nucleoid-associated protein YgaU
MKVKVNREIAVGLSVLLLLTVTLVGVTVWRLTRPTARPGSTIARLDEPRDEQHGKEVEALRPTFADPTPAPVADAPHDNDATNQWQAHSHEKHEDKADRAAEQAAKTFETASPPSLARQDRYDAHPREHAPREPAVLPQEAADDRYSVPPPGRADVGAARPTVIQVSGDSPSEPARQRDERRHEEKAAALDNRAAALPPNELPSAAPGYAQPGYAQPNNAQPGYAQPGNAQLNNAQPNYAAQNYPGQNYPARDPGRGYESTAAAQSVEHVQRVENVQPVDGAQPGYPGPGYARAEAPRRDEFLQTVPPNPLRSDGLYEVLPNDSYWTISQRVYGSGAYFKALAEVNRGKAARPDRLAPGLLISTPPIAQLEKDYPDFCPRPNRREAVRNHAAATASLAAYNGGRIYVVQEGDTLSSIARNELGKVSRWADIYQLNREALGKDYDYLTPGMKLALPPTEGQSPDRTARRLDAAPAATRY